MKTKPVRQSRSSPLLSQHLLNTFLATPGQAQLIFTTHDTDLLDANILSQDSIWFVEKDLQGSSHLYSLAEYPSSQLQALQGQLEHGYFMGRFGAIPFRGNLHQLGWIP